MEKFTIFFRWFNRPTQVFEALGYITVAVGVFIAVVGTFVSIIQWMFWNIPYYLTPNILSTFIMGTIIAIVAPQPFFAISKVIKASEKYLGEGKDVEEEYMEE